MNSILTIQDICYKYGSKLVLEDVYLDVKEGDFLGIVGKNGSGKTTLLKIILGLMKPVCGHIEWRKKSKVGYVEQLTIHSNISFPTNVYETVMLGLYKRIGLFRFPNKTHQKEVLEALKIVGLEGYEKKQISHLSGGEQQRVMIAKALVSIPDLLILDEPTAGIDQEAEQKFIELLYRLNQDYHKTILMVSHDIYALTKCQKIYEMKNKTLKELN